MTGPFSRDAGGELYGSANSYNIGRVINSVTSTPAGAIRLDAAAGPGYTFAGYSIQGPSPFRLPPAASGSQSTTYITAGANVLAATLFEEKDEYVLTATPKGDDVPCSGYVRVDPAQKYYPAGTWVTLEAVANPGYVFVGWEGEPWGMDSEWETTVPLTWLTGSTVSVKMEEDCEVVARFEETVFLDMGGDAEVKPHLRPSDLELPEPDWENETVTVRVFTEDNDESVVFTAEPVEDSGGHIVAMHADEEGQPATLRHAVQRPAGSFTPTSVSQHSTNCFEHSAIYTPSAFSGTYNIVATYKDTVLRDEPLRVKVPGLVSLSSGSTFTVIGVTNHHPDNVNVMPDVAAKLQGIAADYLAQHPDDPPTSTGNQGVAYNDCSLTWGGRFDIGGSWSGSHLSHRVGRQVDMRNWSPKYLQSLLDIIIDDYKGDPVYESNPPHYHINFPEK